MIANKTSLSTFGTLALILTIGCSGSGDSTSDNATTAIEIVKTAPAFGQVGAPTWGEIAGDLARQGVPATFDGEIVVKGWSEEKASDEDYKVFFILEDANATPIATMYWSVNVRSKSVKYMPDKL